MATMDLVGFQQGILTEGEGSVPLTSSLRKNIASVCKTGDLK
jgi:hypothetical protein